MIIIISTIKYGFPYTIYILFSLNHHSERKSQFEMLKNLGSQVLKKT